MIDPNEYYTIREIANKKLIPVGYAGIYNLVRKGKLPARDYSSGDSDKRYRVLGADIINFLNTKIKKF